LGTPPKVGVGTGGVQKKQKTSVKERKGKDWKGPRKGKNRSKPQATALGGEVGDYTEKGQRGSRSQGGAGKNHKP